MLDATPESKLSLELPIRDWAMLNYLLRIDTGFVELPDGYSMGDLGRVMHKVREMTPPHLEIPI